MAYQTAAGAAIAISAGSPASQDATGYNALTYTEIGQVQKIGTIGASFDKTEFQPLKGAKQKLKGAADYGSLQPVYAHDAADAGQTLLRTSANDETNALYAIRVTYQDTTKRYFQGRTFGSPETLDEASAVVTASPTIEICTKVVVV